MINASQIKPHMPVVCSENGQFAVVDHLEGSDTIKLAKDKNGQHHYIPLAWVKTVDDKVHVDRPGDQAMKEWSTEAPKSTASTSTSASQTAGAPTAGKSDAGNIQPGPTATANSKTNDANKSANR